MKSDEEQVASFDGIERVVADSLRFRLKLAIGEDAYTSLRLGKTVSQLWDVGGVAATGAQVAAMPVIASKFFATGGLLSALGLGATAATPIGWVIAASLVTGGAYYGVTRLFRSYSGTRVEVIPKFINTPIDLLGASLLDLMGSVSIKLALIDGKFLSEERAVIRDHFIVEWGFDPGYVDRALEVLEENSDKLSLAEMINSFSSFARSNPDCNFAVMRQRLLVYLSEIATADGHLDEREEMAIERIDRIMREADGTLSQLPRVSAKVALDSIVAAPAGAVGWFSGVSKRLFKKSDVPPGSK
jgi:uncharacterized tellurite resistance protein B-like protein